MTYLLFPGRHLLTTAFQEEYLWSVLRLPINKLDLIGEYKGDPNNQIDRIIFAVTSANQENSRYNPVPFHLRIIGLDRFAKRYKQSININYEIVGIPHFNPNERFAEYTLKEIQENTNHRHVFTPENTIVLCSTPSVIFLYQKMGFAVLPAEYNSKENKMVAKTPIDCIRILVDVDGKWQDKREILESISKSTNELWQDFPQITEKILQLWKDPLLTESGSLTETRNYSTYAFGMNHHALLTSKYHDIKKAIVPGKIVDEGCADGALMTLISPDFPDSDLIGIELTTEFTARCRERQRAGEFGGSFVHFHQRNLMERIFKDNSIDTTICNSTTHELWSYGSGEQSLMQYLQYKFDQLRPGGHLVIRDVVGPFNKEQEVYMKLDKNNGSNDDIHKVCANPEELERHLSGLSTQALFIRFSEDYLAGMRSCGRRGEATEIKYRVEIIDGVEYIVLRQKDASEFMTKKDYLENWQSELNEEFAFWDFDQWKEHLTNVGFRIVENPNEPEASSRVFSIPWIVENRFRDKVELFIMTDNALVALAYPVTNMILIAKKPV